jgi:dTDP-4-amino-4,6-dideoxygalactose transaminase
MSDLFWKVPLSDIDLGDIEIQAVEAVLRSRWLSMGEVTARFEKQAAEYLQTDFAFAVSNGTAALHLACMALNLGPGDEVILPSLTFVATANAILYTGATPIFADIASLDDLTISPAAIETALTPRSRALMVMHYGGYLCDMRSIQEIALRNNLALIEDAAHSPGSRLENQPAGTFGDVGCFSFFANKNLVTGEGGLVVTNRSDLAEKIRRLRSHGMTSLTWDRHHGHAHSYDVVALGYNYRLDEMRSALGLAQLEKLECNNQRRREIDIQYRQAFAQHPAFHIPFSSIRGQSACHLFVLLLNQPELRSAFLEHMRQNGIQTSLHYPPIHRFSYYRQRFGDQDGHYPWTEQASERLVTLPLYASMSTGQIDAVIQAVLGFTW